MCKVKIQCVKRYMNIRCCGHGHGIVCVLIYHFKLFFSIAIGDSNSDIVTSNQMSDIKPWWIGVGCGSIKQTFNSACNHGI